MSTRIDSRVRGNDSTMEGFTLIETILAIVIVGLVITAVAQLTSSSLRIGRISMDRFIAETMAEEGLEIVRNIRDSNWLQNRAWRAGLENGSYAIYDTRGRETPFRLGPASTPNENSKRIIEIGSVPGETNETAMRVKSTVFFNDKKVSLTMDLTNWKKH